MPKDFLRFYKTDDRCISDGMNYPGIPVFFDRHGVVEGISDYMIHLRRTEGHPASTVETYAYQLQKYFKHLRTTLTEDGELDWRNVTDQTLIGWRDRLMKIEGLRDSTVNSYLNTVFMFYHWAEEFGQVKNCVAIHDYEASADKIYQIAAVRDRKGKWSWPYLPKVKDKPDRNTPTPEQLEAVHVNAFELSLTGQRDSLILSFYEDMGLRESEVLSLKVDDIPSWDEIHSALEEDRIFFLTILGKGSKTRHVPALPELMRRAREYIEGDRAKAVSSARKRNLAYRPPKALVVSKTLGNKLNRQYLSKRLSELLKSAGIEGVSGHRVRATFIETQVEASDGYDQTGRPLPAEQVLWKVGEKVGHSSAESTRPYLNKVRSRSFATASDQILDSAGKLKDINRQLAEKGGALAKVNKLKLAADALSRGKTTEASNLLAQLLRQLNNEG